MAGRVCGIVLVIGVAGCGRIDFDPRDAVPDTPRDDAPRDGSGVYAYVFGDQTVETGGTDTHSCGSAEASSFYTLANGAINALVVWHAAKPANDATALIIALYDDAGGNPGNYLSGGTLTPGGQLAGDIWYTLAVPEVSIAANTLYWIAVACPVGAGTFMSVNYKYIGAMGAGPCTPNATTPCTQHSAENNLTTMPATWSPGAVFFPSVNSYYAAHD